MRIQTIFIQNIIGIENSKNINNQFKGELALIFSKLDFYLNYELVNETDCDKLLGANNFFADFFVLRFVKVKFPIFLCPTIFKGSSITWLLIYDISNSFLSKNQLNILTWNMSNKTQNNKIQSLTINLSYEKLTSKTFSAQMFNSVKYLEIEGVLDEIQCDLFKDVDLKTIKFTIENLKDFLHRDNCWMTSLNYHVNASMSNQKSLMMVIRFVYPESFASFNSFYNFPDEDICLFQSFPHDRLVFPVIAIKRDFKCTCTIMFLLNNSLVPLDYSVFTDEKNEKLYYDYVSIEKNQNSVEYCHSKSYNLTGEICDFEEIFSKCDKSKFKSFEDSPINLRSDTDLFYLFIWLKFILLIILKPILCIIAIITNLLSIVVISNKGKRKDFKNQMYQLITLNSVFNIFYSLILLSKLINECLYHNSQVFCSSVYQTNFSQYFKIFVVFFLGNLIRTCSNLTYLSFSLSR